MKTLLLLRHAKSDWSTGEDDFDRPLNGRGNGDLPRLARLLLSYAPRPDLLLSSPALRARQTAQGVSGCLAAEGRLLFDEALYLAPPPRLLQALAAHGGSSQTVLLIAHNPGIEELAGLLCGGRLQMPTGALVALAFANDSWDGLGAGSGHLLFYVVPRLLKALGGGD